MYGFRRRNGPNNPSRTCSTAHTNLSIHYDTYWIAVGNLLFWVFLYPPSWNKFFFFWGGGWTPEYGICSSRPAWWYQFIKFSLALWSMSLRFVTIVVYGFSVHIFCMFCSCLEWNFVLENFSHVCKLVLEFT